MLVSSNETKYWEESPNINEYYKLVTE
ncbi:Hypothetical protein A7A1_2751 [Bacillus subtilis subsp. subtilis str. BSP1]|nr:Hypothetical protein A7A1_2751 [Bacillus subtilis subsp. subtilis str. BSP1]